MVVLSSYSKNLQVSVDMLWYVDFFVKECSYCVHQLRRIYGHADGVLRLVAV